MNVHESDNTRHAMRLCGTATIGLAALAMMALTPLVAGCSKGRPKFSDMGDFAEALFQSLKARDIERLVSDFSTTPEDAVEYVRNVVERNPDIDFEATFGIDISTSEPEALEFRRAEFEKRHRDALRILIDSYSDLFKGTLASWSSRKDEFTGEHTLIIWVTKGEKYHGIVIDSVIKTSEGYIVSNWVWPASYLPGDSTPLSTKRAVLESDTQEACVFPKDGLWYMCFFEGVDEGVVISEKSAAMGGGSFSTKSRPTGSPEGAHASAARRHIRVLKNNDPNVRGSAANALVELGPKAVPALIHVLRDENDQAVCERVSDILVSIGPEAVPALMQAFKHTQYRNLRGWAASTLGRIGSKEAVPVLIEALHSDERFRWLAASALGNIGPNAVPALIKALDSENDDVRRNAAKALLAIGPEAKDAVPRLAKIVRGDLATQDKVFVWALGAIGPEAVPGLIEALSNEYWEIRDAAASELGEIGPDASEAVPALTELLDDENASVRRSAAAALENIRSKATTASDRVLQDEGAEISP